MTLLHLTVPVILPPFSTVTSVLISFFSDFNASINFACAAGDQEKFRNLRAECYWKVRDAINPENENGLAIPERFGRLCSELAAIEWSVTSTGKIQIESKENIKKRLGYSPDHADALALSYAKIIEECYVFEIGQYDFSKGDFVEITPRRIL